MYRVLNVHKIYPVAHDCCGWCSSSGSGLPLPWRGDPLFSSLRKEWSVRRETTIKLSFRCTSAILIENITGDITTSLRKGGGVTSLSHKKHHRSENLEKENNKSSRTSLFIFFTIGIWKIVWCEMFVSVTISFLRLWGVSNCKYWSVLSLLSNFWNITPCRIISWSHKCIQCLEAGLQLQTSLRSGLWPFSTYLYTHAISWSPICFSFSFDKE